MENFPYNPELDIKMEILKTINKKAILYGYLTYFIPGLILIFVGFTAPLIRFVLMVAGGYVTAKIASESELQNVFALGVLNLAMSLLIVTVGLVSTQAPIEFNNLFKGICVATFFSFSAPLLGGGLRLIEKKKHVS